MSHAAKMSPMEPDLAAHIFLLKKKLRLELSMAPSSMLGRAHLCLVGKPAVRKSMRPNAMPFTWRKSLSRTMKVWVPE